MKTHYAIEGDQLSFIVTDLEPRYHETIQALGFAPAHDGFLKTFPAVPAHLDKIFDNFTRTLEPLLQQKAGFQPVAWEEALLKILPILEKHSLDWCLVGSAALAVRGLDIQPGDVDLVTSESDALKLGDLLLDDLIQPVQDSSGWISKWFARAFPGACLEWVGGVNDSADAYGPSDFGPIALRRLETVSWHGYPLRVPPLDLVLETTLRRGRTERAEVIRRALSHGSS